MIEINLIPDVKLELLKARRQQRMVISISTIVALASAGVVVVLSLYVFGVQTVASSLADNGIKSENRDLTSVEDLAKTLTIQSQLEGISGQHDKKLVASRLFDIISTTVPEGKNAVSIARLSLDADENTIDIEGEATNGYEALEVFKKTISMTTFQYSRNGKSVDPIKIASSVADGDRRYGEDSQGRQILRFSLSFEYPNELFETTSQQGRIVAPDRQNVTDSANGVPKSLFGSSTGSGSN